MPKEHPLIFTLDNAQKIADGRKTMSRRVIALPKGGRSQNQYGKAIKESEYIYALCGDMAKDDFSFCRFRLPLAVGSVMWVRESFKLVFFEGNFINVVFRGGGNKLVDANDIPDYCTLEYDRNYPSIHMPKWACRTRRTITEVRIERVQDITTSDIWREGVDNGMTNPKMGKRHINGQLMAFEDLWNSIHGSGSPKSWAANPWVAVYGWEK